MSNIKLLILFNIIIIFLSFQFKNNIIIVYPFIFILLISMFIKLIYKKNIEGNFYDKDSEIFSFWDRLNDETPLEKENSSNNIILNKINQFIDLIMEVEKKGEEEYDKIKCEGRFVKKASKKKCGYNAYNEKVYEITKPGINCNHRDGYSERDFLPRCRLDEKCDSDRDCEKGKCHRGKCQIEFGCSPHKLDNCNEGECDKLNEHVGIEKYAFKDGKCKSNSCNADQFYNCDEEGCINLDYKFMWDEEDKECKNREYDVNTCSQYSCPKGYSNFNGEYQCKKKLSRGELQSKLEQNCENNNDSEGCKGFELNEEDEGFISECNRNVCCMKNYTCEKYFAPKGGNSDCNCENGECDGDGNCFEGDRLDSYKYYENGVEKTKYYDYKEIIPSGMNMIEENKEKKCEKVECNGQECFLENICTCLKGTGATGDDCNVNGSPKCASCNDDYHMEKGECIENECSDYMSCETCPDQGDIHVNELNELGLLCSWCPNGDEFQCMDKQEPGCYSEHSDLESGYQCADLQKCESFEEGKKCSDNDCQWCDGIGCKETDTNCTELCIEKLNCGENSNPNGSCTECVSQVEPCSFNVVDDSSCSRGKCCSVITGENECKSSFYHLGDKKYKCLYKEDKCKSSLDTGSGGEAKLCNTTP